MATPINPALVRWRCRRGMLELDEILQPFFDRHFHQLSEKQKSDFVRLLECSDQDLFNWFLGKSQPTEPHIVTMIQLIHDRRRYG